jgi:hypothetical protein
MMNEKFGQYFSILRVVARIFKAIFDDDMSSLFGHYVLETPVYLSGKGLGRFGYAGPE